MNFWVFGPGLRNILFDWFWSNYLDHVKSEFSAVIQFRNASEHKRAISILLRVAKLNDERGNSFHAGKSFDSASASSRELGDLEGVLSYADQGMFLGFILRTAPVQGPTGCVDL